MAFSHPITVAAMAQVFMDNVYKLHGRPSTIVSDRDSIFLINFWQEFTRLQGISLAMSTAFTLNLMGKLRMVVHYQLSYCS
ncbi:hypothetical protein L1987_53245 [Smallanthus sonchifolius]|uniref:Uncharacterized protein n=1 Tax=Smallanthus sonchifolius TaxID=185202 RepID=A0ACB9EUV1_9ASTR|nr:hypothetical protein L1987_53245 [Smallanthus sonchifolius]